MKSAGSSFWAIRSLGPTDVEALLEVQSRAPLGALEWARSEFVTALSNPWRERVGYLTLGLCISIEQNRPLRGAATKEAVYSNISEFNLSSSYSEAGYVVENHFEHMLGGFIILHIVDDEADVQHLAVDSSLNGRGGGRALLQEALIRLAICEVKLVFLEVRASNKRALDLYERVGFRKVGVRAGYYSDVGEDAVVMQYAL